MSTTDPEEAPLPARRSQPHHRRVDSDAGAPAGESAPAILDLPATAVSPADIGPLTVQLPGVDELPLVKDGRVVSRPGQSPAALAGLFASRERASAGSGSAAAASGGHASHGIAPPGIAPHEVVTDDAPSAGSGSGTSAPLAVDDDVPAPGDLDGAGKVRDGKAPDGIPHGSAGQPLTRRQLRELRRRQEPQRRQESRHGAGRLRRAEAPEGAPAAVAGARGEPHDGADETGALPTVPPAGDAAAAEPVRHEPVEAQSAHGLDSLAASEWGARERTLMIVAGAVFLVLVIALILALVL